MFRLTDIRKTTRRSSTAGVRTIHPKLMRDRSLAPRIELAIRYLDGMIGRPRRDLDEEVLLQLFGDHKLARCVVACLAATYRHRARAFDEVLSIAQVEALAREEIGNASELRLWLYRRANVVLPGFVGGSERAPFLRTAAAEFGLTLDQIETLLTLDAPANAILARSGPIPTADDVIARFNYEVLAALVANASLVRLSLQRAPRDAAAIGDVCGLLDVRAALSGRELVLHGRQDALNNWARHGARVTRLLAALLVCGLGARSGEATICAPTGDEWHLRLDEEMLGYLGAPGVAGSAPMDAATLLTAYSVVDKVAAEFSALRRAGGSSGWRLRRTAEPLVVRGAVVPALFVCQRGEHRVPVVPLPASTTGRAWLRQVAARFPLVALSVVGEEVVDSASRSDMVCVSVGNHIQGDAGPPSVADLPALLDRSVASVARQAELTRLEAVYDEARQTGVLTEPQLAKRLGCSEDEVAERLSELGGRVPSQKLNLRYIDGFGLCSAEVLTRARAAADDVATMRNNPQVGSAWMLRVLGRKLREVTGASEGIECLIAYLGAA